MFNKDGYMFQLPEGVSKRLADELNKNSGKGKCYIVTASWDITEFEMCIPEMTPGVDLPTQLPSITVTT